MPPRFLLPISCCIALAGCAGDLRWRAYQPSPGGGGAGYRETSFAPDSWSVVYIGSSGMSPADAERLARRRARERCPHGFIELPQDLGTIEISDCHHWNRDCGPARAQLWIRCKTS